MQENVLVMEDKSRLFKDFNFKLVVLNSLLEKKASFIDDLDQIKYTDKVIPFLENVLLTDGDMDMVDCLQFGDNLKIYTYIPFDFDKEIHSMEDMDLLYNLKSVEYE